MLVPLGISFINQNSLKMHDTNFRMPYESDLTKTHNALHHGTSSRSSSNKSSGQNEGGKISTHKTN